MKGQVRTGKVRSDQDRSDLVRTGHLRTGHGSKFCWTQKNIDQNFTQPSGTMLDKSIISDNP